MIQVTGACLPRDKFLGSHTHWHLQPHHLSCQMPTLRLTPDTCKMMSPVPERGSHPRLLGVSLGAPLTCPGSIPGPRCSCSVPRSLILPSDSCTPKNPTGPLAQAMRRVRFCPWKGISLQKSCIHRAKLVPKGLDETASGLNGPLGVSTCQV